MKRKVLLVLLALVVITFSGCDFFLPPPDAPTSITAAAGDESITVSWAASADATAYDLYYTNDGTTPTLNSQKVSDITATSYVLSGLSGDNSGKSYIFALTAKKDSKIGDLSAPTTSVKPLPVLTVNFINGIENMKVLLLILDVPYNPASGYVEGNAPVQKTASGYTNSYGSATLSGSFDRSKYLGYTVIYDFDNSGTLTTGDASPDYGNGGYGYSYYFTKKEISLSTTYDAYDHYWYWY